MKPKVLFSTKLSNLRPVILYGEPIYLRHDKILNILDAYVEDGFSQLLAIPDIPKLATSGTTQAHWLSSHLKKPISFIDLPSSKKVEVQKVLSGKIEKILEVATELKASDIQGNQQLGELLEYSIEIPSEEFIFVDGDKICLAAWGFAHDKSSDRSTFKLTKFLERTNSSGNSSSQKIMEGLEKEHIDKPVLSKRLFYALLAVAALIMSYFAYNYFTNRSSPLVTSFGGISHTDPESAVKIAHDPLRRSSVPEILLVSSDSYLIAVEKIKKLNKELEIIGFNESFGLIQVRLKNVDELAEIKKEIEKIQEVDFVVLDTLLQNDSTYNDPALRDNEKTYWLDQVEARKAWKVARGSNDIVVAVLDVGFDLSHPEIIDKILKPADIVSGTSEIQSTGKKHGTHVAALIAASGDNGKGIVGVCPACMLMPIQVSHGDKITSSSILAGLSYAAANKAKVINLSLGLDSEFDLSQLSGNERASFLKLISKLTRDDERLWNSVFEKLSARGIVVVQAAGNDNIDSSFDPMKRSKHTILVSAVARDSTKADYSNFSGEADSVSAPGSNIYSAVPSDSYAFMTGTSMATPIVSGGVGLLLGQHQGLTVSEIKKVLIDTGKSINSSNSIGNLIQLSAALDSLDIKLDCNCKDEVRALKDEIERLKKVVVDAEQESLKIPEKKVADFSFAKGSWVSSKNLVNTSNNTPVRLHFQFFENGQGKLELIEKTGLRCMADLSLKLENRKLNIKQLSDAVCDDKSGYNPYHFSCVPESDNNNIAICEAKNKNKASLVKFKLFKEN